MLSYFIRFCHPYICDGFLIFFSYQDFFFLSGFLFHLKGIKANIVSIINGLLIPYFIFSLILAFILGNKVEYIDDYLQNFVCMFVYGHDQIWFIPCVILVELYATIILNATKDVKILYSLTFLTFLSSFLITNNTPHHLAWNIDTSAYAFFFYGRIFNKGKIDLSLQI